MRSRTDGALTGSDDEQYSEAKFLQVKQVIERFRGREGQAEIGRRWTLKVTDVRNWFVFAKLQLLIVTPLQKIHVIEPYVDAVGLVHNPEGRASMLRNLAIEEYREEKARAVH